MESPRYAGLSRRIRTGQSGFVCISPKSPPKLTNLKTIFETMSDHFTASPAVQAARWILTESERRERLGKPRISLREAAARFRCGKTAVGTHLKSMKLFGRPAFSTKAGGHPRNLDESEDRALVAYVMWLERCDFSANQVVIEDAENELRASRSPPDPPAGQGWYKRFVADNPELQKKKLVRALDRERAGFEAGEIAEVEQFYTDLGVVIEERDISAS
ncbi:uncharacterized protein FPOAC1_013206 [Fusarium poae]|uniref:uncharacterized protein n=1 Tax=Fusarium poae TaxID=36050 RepID=UPI001D03B3DF|nr:uncharacterized protein FPOAC1_013206 [Fusarium poae]KAG8665227.1 hypothetical protein FPOAC1_013206 [Fusarium poae]